MEEEVTTQWQSLKVRKEQFGKCDVEIRNTRKVEPKESIRGEIARTYIYMDSGIPWQRNHLKEKQETL